jgi:hypothetical protein
MTFENPLRRPDQEFGATPHNAQKDSVPELTIEFVSVVLVRGHLPDDRLAETENFVLAGVLRNLLRTGLSIFSNSKLI